MRSGAPSARFPEEEAHLALVSRRLAQALERNPTAEGGADGPAGKREMRAAEHGRVHAAGIGAELPREVGRERG